MRSTERNIAVLEGDRWDVLTRLIGDDQHSVLDVGCRDRRLADHLPQGSRYVGMDLFPPADVIASAEEPFPFPDDAFASVVLADVLEHLDDPHGALDEAMRVADRSVIVLLPNLYTLWLRLQYLRGVPSDKYRFGPDNSLDRHRWLMNFDQAASFARERAARSGWHVAREFGYSRAFRRPLARMAYRAARAVGGPNLWSWEYAARLERGSADDGSASRRPAIAAPAGP